MKQIPTLSVLFRVHIVLSLTLDDAGYLIDQLDITNYLPDIKELTPRSVPGLFLLRYEILHILQEVVLDCAREDDRVPRSCRTDSWAFPIRHLGSDISAPPTLSLEGIKDDDEDSSGSLRVVEDVDL